MCVNFRKMLNQHAVESLYSATYVEDYLDSMENLPDDVMKQLTKMKEMDVHFQRYLTDLESQMKILLESQDPRKENVAKSKLQNILICAQDKGDEKLQIVQQVQDFVDNKVRQLELDEKNLEFGKDVDNDSRHDTTKVSETSDRPVKRARRARHEVFVPSILGPSTLEATSFNPDPSVAAASAHAENHHNTKTAQAHSSSTTHSTTVAASSTSVSTPAPVHVSHASTSAAQVPHVETVERSTKSSSASNTISEDKSNFSAAATTTTTTTTSSTTPKKQASHKKEVQEKKVKRRKANKQSDNSPPNIPIDPDEPTYCLCDQVSYGEMIGCDNDLCPIEWFHFSCVQLTTKPKGKWYCPKCRGDRPNVMKPKAIFLKELEKYNREKEEKS